MKNFRACSFLLLLLLLLLGRISTFATAADDDVDEASTWSLALANAVGDEATLNKVWCASPSGDLAFGPVQGADTSSPDASIWAATQSKDQFLLQLRLPSTLDYSCRLETAPSLWSFSLPLATLKQDGYASGSIKCHSPWYWPGFDPEHIPPGCQLFGADGFSIASVVVSSLAVDQPADIAPAPAPTPASDSSSSTTSNYPASSSSSSIFSSPAPGPLPISDTINDDSASKQPLTDSPPSLTGPSPTPTTTAPAPVASSTASTPTGAPAPPRKLK